LSRRRSLWGPWGGREDINEGRWRKEGGIRRTDEGGKVTSEGR